MVRVGSDADDDDLFVLYFSLGRKLEYNIEWCYSIVPPHDDEPHTSPPNPSFFLVLSFSLFLSFSFFLFPPTSLSFGHTYVPVQLTLINARATPARCRVYTFKGASHWLRPIRMWMGTPTKMIGVVGKSLAHMAGISMSTTLIKFESGKTAIMESVLAPKGISEQPFFSIQGTLGELVIGGFGGGCTLHTVEDDVQVSKELCHEGWDAGYAGEYADFAAACTSLRVFFEWVGGCRCTFSLSSAPYHFFL